MSAYRRSHHIGSAIGRALIAAAPVLGLAIAFIVPVPVPANSLLMHMITVGAVSR